MTNAPKLDGAGALVASETFHVLLALLAIIVLARLLGGVGRRIGQPRVIGEIIAGLVFGPSFLGRIAPGATAYVMRRSIAPELGVLSEVGIICALQ